MAEVCRLQMLSGLRESKYLINHTGWKLWRGGGMEYVHNLEFELSLFRCGQECVFG